MKLKKKTEKLIDELIALLRACPGKGGMGSWVWTPKGGDLLYGEVCDLVKKPEKAEAFVEKCGTKACIAGWIVLLRPKQAAKILAKYYQPTVADIATEILGLPDDYATESLFYDFHWPTDVRGGMVGRLKRLKQELSGVVKYETRAEHRAAESCW